MRYDPHDYQKYAVGFIKDHPVSAVLLDMGMGKSPITLTAVNDLMFDSFDIRKVLVIAPLRVAKNTWSAEIEKWDHLSGLKYSIAVGTAAERMKALKTDADIYIINRENVPWLVEKSGLPFDYDMVVIDELSSFKNHQAKRFKALMKVRPKVKRVIGLTGTPSSNGLMDLFAEYKVLDIEIPKKQGKSELAAAVALLLCCGDGEERAEVYGCAADRQQASIVFEVAADMVRMCPALNKRVKILYPVQRHLFRHLCGERCAQAFPCGEAAEDPPVLFRKKRSVRPDNGSNVGLCDIRGRIIPLGAGIYRLAYFHPFDCGRALYLRLAHGARLPVGAACLLRNYTGIGGSHAQQAGKGKRGVHCVFGRHTGMPGNAARPESK